MRSKGIELDQRSEDVLEDRAELNFTCSLDWPAGAPQRGYHRALFAARLTFARRSLQSLLQMGLEERVVTCGERIFLHRKMVVREPQVPQRRMCSWLSAELG